MKKNILLFLIFLHGIIGISKSQERASYDGILIKSSPANDHSFYYGEPFEIFFEFSNTKNVVNPYYKPVRGVNVNYFLKEVGTGKLFQTGPNYWERGSEQRDEQRTAPSDKNAFQPGESGNFVVQVNADFGQEALTQQQVNVASDLSYRLVSLPVGKYELVLQYYVMPTGKVLTIAFPFDVIQVPSQEQEAFEQYVQTTEYACNAHSYANNNYSPSNPRSYENFLKKHPNSLFSHYAFFDMVTVLYFYGKDEKAKVVKYKDYISYYPKLRKSSQKMRYMRHLPYIYSHIPGKDAKKELDSFLYNIKNENPAYSKSLIRNAEFHHKIKGLKNYASQGNPNNKG